MTGIIGRIEEFIRQLLCEWILANLSNLFTEVNDKVSTIAGQVGQTPQGWNNSIYNIIHNLSENVMVPIAGMIITFVLCYELIGMVMEKNNMHDIDTWMFFKYVFKMWVAVYLVSHTFDIVMAVFDVAQHVVSKAGSVISTNTNINVQQSLIEIFNHSCQYMSLGELLGLCMETLLVSLTMKIMSVLITVILYGRMIEIYLYVSISPIPFATMTNREWGGIGNNYLKGLFALGFQGFFIMVCVGIYAVLVQSVTVAGNLHSALFAVAAHTIILCFSLFKTDSLAKSVFSAH